MARSLIFVFIYWQDKVCDAQSVNLYYDVLLLSFVVDLYNKCYLFIYKGEEGREAYEYNCNKFSIYIYIYISL